MSTKLSIGIMLVVLLASVAVGIYLYPRMPAEIASHWNAGGQVDGYMSKFWGIFIFPIILAVMTLLFWIIPKIDPLKSNIEKFRPYYNGLIVLISVFLAYVYAFTILWNSGVEINAGRFLSPAFAVLFFYIGVLLTHAEQNWTIGIRTPWTLSSNNVWKKTHRLGSVLFKISGVLSLVGVLIPTYAFHLVLIPVIISAIVVFVYSYIAYRNEKRN